MSNTTPKIFLTLLTCHGIITSSFTLDSKPKQDTGDDPRRSATAPEDEHCVTILPSWPDASIPEFDWAALTGNITTRGARSAKCGGGECACESGGQNLLLVDCSRAETPNILTHGLEDHLELSDRSSFKNIRNSSTSMQEVRLVIMGSELTALHSLGNTSITRAHFKYNPGLSYIADDALRPSTSTLIVLDLRNNNLSSPMDMNIQFERLQFLSLDDNDLETIPKWVSGTSSLVHLSLANNLIRGVTESALRGLHNLQFLNLHKNLLTSPPAHLQLPMLRSLVLQGNPITHVPQGNNSICVAYYSQ